MYLCLIKQTSNLFILEKEIETCSFFYLCQQVVQKYQIYTKLIISFHFKENAEKINFKKIWKKNIYKKEISIDYHKIKN